MRSVFSARFSARFPVCLPARFVWLAAAGLIVAGCHPSRPLAPTTPDGDQLCVGWIRRYGEVTCYLPLTTEQASHRGHAKLTFRGGKVARVVLLSGAGGVQTDDADDSGFEVTYADGGSTLRWFNRWNEPTAITVDRRTSWERRTPWGAPKRVHAGDAYRHVRTEDANGFVASDKLVDESGRPVEKDGVCETRFEHDAEGRDLAKSYFDAAGRPVLDTYGYHRIVEHPAPLGCADERMQLDVEGRPIGGMQGVPRSVRKCDAWGNIISVRWVDGSGLPVLNAQGIHGWDDVLDAHGALITRTHVGVDGKPAPVNAQESIRRYKVDARGYTTEAWFLDAAGAPFVTANGNAGWRSVVAANGAVLAVQYVDANGAPVRIDAGYAAVRTRYDDRGHVVTTEYTDEHDAPAKRAGGAFLDNTFDERGQVASVTTRGADGQLITSHQGFARVVYARNDEGRIVSRKHYDAAGAPVEIPGVRTMSISYVGTTGKRPATISRAKAEERAREAMARLARKEPWLRVAKQLTESSTDEPTYAGQHNWYAPLWEAIAKLPPGAPPVLLDTERGFFIVERVE